MVYVIVGPPRSGTSALAAVLAEQKIQMFMASDPSTVDSPGGNREDNLGRLLNNYLMTTFADRRHRADWDDPSYVPGAPAEAVRKIRAYSLLRSRHAGGPWGFKDPRLCFLIEPWSDALSGTEVTWLFIERQDREATIASLIRMLPWRLRTSEPAAIRGLVRAWANSFHLASELGFRRTGLVPLRFCYEQLLTQQGQQDLITKLGFDSPITKIDRSLNREGRRRTRTSTEPRPSAVASR